MAVVDALDGGELVTLRALAVALAERIDAPSLEPKAPLAAQLRATLERITVLAPPAVEETQLDRIRALRRA